MAKKKSDTVQPETDFIDETLDPERKRRLIINSNLRSIWKGFSTSQPENELKTEEDRSKSVATATATEETEAAEETAPEEDAAAEEETIPAEATPEEETEKDSVKLQKEIDNKFKFTEHLEGILSEIDSVRDQRKNLSARHKRLEAELREAIQKGPDGMFNRPLLDLAEKSETPTAEHPKEQIEDSQIWRETPIESLDLKENLITKLKDHFQNVGDLVDWLNLPDPPKKKGIGKAKLELIQDAVNKIHEPVIQSELIKAENLTEEMKNDNTISIYEEWNEWIQKIEAMSGEPCYDFAYGTLAGIREWVSEHQYITPEQIQSVENIRTSVPEPMEFEWKEENETEEAGKEGTSDV
ncbi:MAG: hypothetical protein LBQ54_07580 [Planctomycetaceae bacterium]|jgi:hypothetical protein|nr:hypothetical protein [Planctomycetaceae bacterium]